MISTGREISALVPRLTALDERVLGALPLATESGLHSADLAHRVARTRWPWVEHVREVALALRGLEHLGYASCRNGYWKRTEANARAKVAAA